MLEIKKKSRLSLFQKLGNQTRKLGCHDLLFVRRYDEDHLHILWRSEGEDNDDDKGDDDADFGGGR